MARGHLFIVDGDLTRLACDHVLVPTDAQWVIESWAEELCGPGFDEIRNAFPPGSTWDCVGSAQPKGDSHRQQPPKVWFANVESTGLLTEGYRDLIDQFVEQATEGATGRLVLGVNFIGSGKGGSSFNKGGLVESLISALLEQVSRARENLTVDIVFVARGQVVYSAAQRARRRLTSSENLDEPLSAYSLGVLRALDLPNSGAVELAVKDLSEASQSDRLVPFIGAGLGVGAGLPRWSKLLEMLAEVVGRKDGITPLDASSDDFRSLDARDQAELIESRLSRSSMREELASILDVERHSLGHALIASCDPKNVVTTNYDRLSELAFPAERRPAVLPRESVDVDGRWILKLHGDIGDSDSIVLTRSDYLGLPSGSQALLGILQAMLITQHMLFVGYSLQDDTFHRVMFDVQRAQEGRQRYASPQRTGTVLLVSENHLVRSMWDGRLNVVALHESDPTAGGRHLEILLDLVAFESADITSFILDDTYSSLLSAEERNLREAINAVAERARSAGSVGHQVLELFERLTNPEE